MNVTVRVSEAAIKCFVNITLIQTAAKLNLQINFLGRKLDFDVGMSIKVVSRRQQLNESLEFNFSPKNNYSRESIFLENSLHA